MSQPKTARFLIIQALAMHGPLTSTELHEKIPSLTLKQIKDNVTAAKAPGYIKSQLDVTQGAAVHQLTPDGKRWWKANQATPEKSTTSSTATTDKPGVSATTPEASVHGSLPLPAVADARPENAPVEAAPTADTGGDGQQAVDITRLEAWVESQSDGAEFSIDCAATVGLGLNLADMTTGTRTRIGIALRAMGCSHIEKRTDSNIKKLYRYSRKAGAPTDVGYDLHTAQAMISYMGAALDAIEPIARAYIDDNQFVQDGVRTMDMLIDADGAYIELLEHQLEYRDRLIKDLDAQIDLMKQQLKVHTATDESPVDSSKGLFVVASGWQTFEGLEAANEGAIQKAFSSVSGKAVIARPVQVAEVAVQLKEFPQCAAATAPLSN